MTDLPPIPATCANRPTIGGLVVPYLNIRLADGGADFRTPSQTRYARCWQHNLCQTCGDFLTYRSVLFGGPNQLRRRRFDEPPLCPPCASYATHACPMVAGRMPRYADRRRLAEGHRGKTCPDPGCDCGGYTDADPNARDTSGDPAHPWYALYVPTGGWQVTGHEVKTTCSDRGCVHTRVIVDGCYLTTDPMKVMLVSEPGAGRIWRRLSDEEITALIPAVQRDRA